MAASTSASSALRFPVLRRIEDLSTERGAEGRFEPEEEGLSWDCKGRADAIGDVSGVGDVREREGGTSSGSAADWEA